MLSFFLDLDGTLYSAETGLWPEIKRRITLFLQVRLGLSPREAESLHAYFVRRYGTTLRGLQSEYPQISPRDYFAFAHNVNLERYLKPAPRLRELLCSLPGQRWVFTNSDAAYAERVLSVLGVRECLHGIIDIFATGLTPKPHPRAYALAREKAGSPPPKCCILVDDLPQNLPPAKKAGWHTVLVGKANSDFADFSIPNIYRISQVLEEKPWNGCLS